MGFLPSASQQTAMTELDKLVLVSAVHAGPVAEASFCAAGGEVHTTVVMLMSWILVAAAAVYKEMAEGLPAAAQQVQGAAVGHVLAQEELSGTILEVYRRRLPL